MHGNEAGNLTCVIKMDLHNIVLQNDLAHILKSTSVVYESQWSSLNAMAARISWDLKIIIGKCGWSNEWRV